jgi:hypothetical protein
MIGTTLSDRAAVSNAGIKFDTGAVSGLNMTAARFRPGAISESSKCTDDWLPFDMPVAGVI